MRPLYRYREDIAPSLVVLGIFSLQLYIFFCVQSLYAVGAVMLGLLSFSALPGSIAHNHHHVPTFMRPWMNRLYELILFFETGILPYAWTIHHNIGHHKDYLDQEKDPTNWRLPDGRVMSRLHYDVMGALRIYPEIVRIGRRHPELFRRFKIWSAVAVAALGVFLLIDPVKALLLFIVPVPVMYLGLLDNTYMQHSDLDTGSAFTASRNTSSRLYNVISWNLGYHTAHHLKPHVHWSRLPQLHAQIESRIPDGMKCDSVFLSACDYRHSRQCTRPAARRQPAISRYPVLSRRWRPAQTGMAV